MFVTMAMPGQCSYLRLVYSKNRVHCSLVVGKSRVTPLKPATIPRLELIVALVSSKIGCILRKELDYVRADEGDLLRWCARVSR